jgi:hypothetical protein
VGGVGANGKTTGNQQTGAAGGIKRLIGRRPKL